MALQDFIQKLKEQDDSDVVYSKPLERPIQIIPPEKINSSITLEPKTIETKTKVIPPESEIVDKPKTIKFKLNIPNSSQVVEKEVENVPKLKIKFAPKTNQIEQTKQVEQKVEQNIKTQTLQQNEKPKTEEDIVEELFRASGTSPTKRALWFDYYEKAKESRKKNSVVDRMKQGKFAVTIDNQVLILPDHEIRNKSSSQLLGEKWLNNY